MKGTPKAFIVALLTTLTTAAYPPDESVFRFWEDAGCPSTASSNRYTDLLLPPQNDACISGTSSLKWPTSTGADSIQIAYFNAKSLPESCTLAILQQANLQPGDCGTAVDVIRGGKDQCQKGKLPIKGGQALCCGGVGDGCAVVPSGTKKARNVTEPEVAAPRDVTSVKRSGIADRVARLSKRDCAFKADGGTYQGRGRQQIVTSGVSCPPGQNSCSIQKMVGVTQGSSNSFGVSDSVTAGTDFFADIQDTISFSYMYTYMESSTVQDSYTVNVPAGETGYITWTPTSSCVNGTFSGDCQWNTAYGTACIPLNSSSTAGSPLGQYAFLESQ